MAYASNFELAEKYLPQLKGWVKETTGLKTDLSVSVYINRLSILSIQTIVWENRNELDLKAFLKFMKFVEIVNHQNK